MSLVAIYRHHLFKVSESFIHTQAINVPRHEKLYVGRTCVGPVPVDADVAVLDRPRMRSTFNRVYQVLTRDPEPFVEMLEGRDLRLVHAHFGIDAVYAQRVAARLKVPLVTTFHGFDATLSAAVLLKSGKPSLVNYWLHRRQLASDGTLFLCVSQFIRDRVLRLGFPPERTRVHYIGVDTDRIRPPTERTGRPVILHVARLVEKKGTADLIAAFALVQRVVPDAQLIIVGDGPLGQMLKSRVRDLELDTSVKFTGALANAEVLKLMASSSVFCLPSVTAPSGDSEGLAIVLLEAAASGLPIVATRHGGFVEAIDHERTGILHAEHDVAGLADSLSRLLKEDGVRNGMGRAARENVVEKFDIKRQSQALAKIYDSI